MPTTQEVLDKITEHEKWVGNPANGTRLDLINEDLTQVDDTVFFERVLCEGQFNGAVISGKDFRGANCEGANFAGASLLDCSLYRAKFTQCDFSNANLRRACGHHAIWDRCDFTGADLREVDMRHSNFDQCDFTDALMSRAPGDSHLAAADFSYCNMTACLFIRTNTRRAVMVGVDMTGSTMTTGPFHHTDFSDAVFANVLLTTPDFTAAIFRAAAISGRTDFATAVMDEATVQYTTLDRSGEKYEPKSAPE